MLNVFLHYQVLLAQAHYFLNLLRPNSARLTKPEPSSKSVAGSGIAAKIPPSFPVETVLFVSADGFETKVDEIFVAGISFLGQASIPKNKIKIHKNINKFLILSPP
jgi:hypothetical protein